ncbi:hypothetical protein I3843_04G049000 [Carya illinoinensis]|nr:hypothetical protein I3760_04G052900 [Carya illinoinensis]KAG7982367.1 hypothetical protein I3843_04G049000 [Carya illinoinensis]
MVGETSKKLAHFLLVTTVLMMMMIFSPHTTRWGAAASSIQLDNGTLTSLDYQGRMEEPELLFDSEISRMLASYTVVTKGTQNRGKPVVPSCGGRSPQYVSCLPRGDNSKQGCKRRGTYQRGCK